VADLIAPDELHRWRQRDLSPLVIDIRGPEEHAKGHLPGAVLIPADELASRLAEIPPDRTVVTY
jgi:rhodanese-related sulfurtransferase